jgi:membrane protein YdbS with pleckstrin-like domain
MLTQEEEDFILYWQQNRLQKRRWIKQLSVGLPMALALVAGIAVNLFSGWYTRAQMVLFRESASLVIILLIAAVALVIFMIVFSSRHRWDQLEQRYLELMQRKEAKGGPVVEHGSAS